jgi:hypothetical protein
MKMLCPLPVPHVYSDCRDGRLYLRFAGREDCCHICQRWAQEFFRLAEPSDSPLICPRHVRAPLKHHATEPCLYEGADGKLYAEACTLDGDPCEPCDCCGGAGPLFMQYAGLEAEEPSARLCHNCICRLTYGRAKP